MASDNHVYSGRHPLTPKTPKTGRDVLPTVVEHPEQPLVTPRMSGRADKGQIGITSLNTNIEKNLQVWMARVESQMNYWHAKHQQWLEHELPSYLTATHSGAAAKPWTKAHTYAGESVPSLMDESMSRGGNPKENTSADSEEVDIAELEKVALEDKLGFLGSGVANSGRAMTELVRWRNWRHLIDHGIFNWLVSFAIVANAILVGIQIELSCLDVHDRKHGNGTFFVLAEITFSLFFFAEFVVRVVILRGQIWRNLWNVYDMLLMVFQFADFLVIFSSAGDYQVRETALRTVLVFLRLARVIRLLRFSKFLWTMFDSIVSSLCCVLRLLLALSIWVYMVCVVLTAGVAERLSAGVEDHDDRTLMEKHFGNLLATVYTLFSSITSGVTWTSCFDALFRLQPHLALLFFMFILVGNFSLLNLIAGTVIEGVFHNASVEREAAIVEQRSKTEDLCMKLSEALQSNGDRRINLNRLLIAADDAHLSHLFRAMQIQPRDIWRLFNLLDYSQRGEIVAQDFIDGCVRLRAGTQSVDPWMLFEMEMKSTRLHRQTEQTLRSLLTSFLDMPLKAAINEPWSPRSGDIPSDTHDAQTLSNISASVFTPGRTTSTPKKEPSVL